MHLLAATPGTISDGAAAVDLGQTPGEIVVLSAADSEIACLAAAQRALVAAPATAAPDWPSLRLASLLKLGHHLSVDLYVDSVVAHAKLVVVRLLGGRAYWPHGAERIVQVCRERDIPLALLPGDDKPDDDLVGLSTLPAESTHRLWRYLVEG